MKVPEFYPDIYSYLNEVDESLAISTDGFDKLFHKISAQTGLSIEQIEFVFIEFFSEVRKAVANGDVVYLSDVGELSFKETEKGNIIRYLPPFKLEKSIQK